MTKTPNGIQATLLSKVLHIAGECSTRPPQTPEVRGLPLCRRGKSRLELAKSLLRTTHVNVKPQASGLRDDGH